MSDLVAPGHLWSRPAAVCGVLGAGLLHTGATLLGDTPDTRDSSIQIADYFQVNRDSILAGSILMTAGFAIVVGMGLTIARRLEAAGDRSIAALLRAASTTAGTVYLLTLPLVDMTLSYIVAAEAPEHAKTLFELSLVGSNILAWPLAFTFAASGLGLRRISSPSAIAYVWLLAAALVAMATVSVARSGYFSPDVQQQVLVLSTITWIATTGFARTASAENTAGCDAAPPTSAARTAENTFNGIPVASRR